MKPVPQASMVRGRLVGSIAAFALVMSAALTTHAGAEQIAQARYDTPVDRYGHFALGRPHEYARLAATTDAGRTLVFELPASEVFEDLAPRIVSLATGEPAEILAIVSNRVSGSRLMLLHLNGGRLEISAQSDAIGTPMRWLNPVGVADLDGDGRVEIAAVITPHIGGLLKVYRKQGARLVEKAALSGFSNHVYGAPELALSIAMAIEGRMRLLVPDTSRLHIRIVAFENGRLVQTGRCTLTAPLTGAIRLIPPAALSLGLQSGRQVIAPGGCRD